MKIVLKIDNEKGEETNLTLTNEEYNNFNFVSLIIDNNEYDVTIDELYEAVLTFKRIKDRDSEKEDDLM